MQGQSCLIGMPFRVRRSPGCCGFCFGRQAVTYQREALGCATFRRVHRPFLPTRGGGDCGVFSAAIYVSPCLYAWYTGYLPYYIVFTVYNHIVGVVHLSVCRVIPLPLSGIYSPPPNTHIGRCILGIYIIRIPLVFMRTVI